MRGLAAGDGRGEGSAMTDTDRRERMPVTPKLEPTPTFEYVAHPLAATFPMIEGAAFAELKADILNHGIQEPIRLYQGMILDGRNRFAAAKAAGYQFTPKDFREWTGTLVEAEAWVISTNF